MRFKDKVKKRYKVGGITGVISSGIIKIIALIRTRFMMLYFCLTKPCHGLNATEKRNPRVIVSMTSFPPRFSQLHYCVRSLLRQTYKPDKILLYLGSDTKEEDVTINLTKLTRYGLEIRFVPDNLKAYTKFYYSMQEYSDDIIITVDDDVIYDKDLLESFIKSYKEYPNAVSARRVHKMLTNKNGELVPYNDFVFECRKIKKPSFQLFATGVGGILYPPHCLSQDVFYVELFMKLCPGNDDVWLKFMQILGNTPIIWVASGLLKSKLMELPNGKIGALNMTNVGTTADNDLFIAQLQEYYSINLADYCEL